MLHFVDPSPLCVAFCGLLSLELGCLWAVLHTVQMEHTAEPAWLAAPATAIKHRSQEPHAVLYRYTTLAPL